MSIRLPIWILSVVLIWVTGCSTPPTPIVDPLSGWREMVGAGEHPNRAIIDDYHSYIQSLPPRERERVQMFIDDAHVYEDGTGQHAFRLEIGDGNGTDWAYVAIYDKDNKRIKVFKYMTGHYRS